MGQLIIIVVIIRVSFACNGCENDGCRLGDLCVGLGHDGLPGGMWGPRSIGIISTSLKNEASMVVFSSPNFLQNFQNSHHIESLNVPKDTCIEYEM